MMELSYYDIASYSQEQFSWERNCMNYIYVLDGELWVKSVVKDEDDFDAEMIVCFEINKEFIQELKALVMVMENTFVEGEQ